MSPPDSVLAGSVRLSLDKFAAGFSEAWSLLESRFLKLECWQAYQEGEKNESQAAYDRGEIARARELLHREAEADRPLYDVVAQRGIEYARVRLVQEPLTPYLRYELLSYQIRSKMGENIEVVRFGDAQQLPSSDYFDFLLFDRHTALIHDYGSGDVGRQTGGWLTRRTEVIDRLETIIAELRRRAIPLSRYVTELGTCRIARPSRPARLGTR